MTTSPDSPALSRLELLVLARLSGGKKPPSPDDTFSTLERYVPGERGKDDLRALLRNAEANLRAKGLIDSTRHVTSAGHGRLRHEFGHHKKLDWRTISARYAPTKLAGIPAQTKKLGGKTGSLVPSTIAGDLGLQPGQTLAGTIDALLAREIGLPPGPVTLKRIKAHLLAKHLEVEVALDPKTRLPDAVPTALRYIEKRLGVPPQDVEIGLIRRWLSERPLDIAEPSTSPAPANRETPTAFSTHTPATTSTATPPVDDTAFASLVSDVAHSIGPNGRFGDQKVFISAIWEELSGSLDISLEDLKRRLLDAQRKSLISLARADIPSAMNADLVRASEIADATSNFHFVIDAGRH